jgi:hypothetical protein
VTLQSLGDFHRQLPNVCHKLYQMWMVLQHLMSDSGVHQLGYKAVVRIFPFYASRKATRGIRQGCYVKV